MEDVNTRGIYTDLAREFVRHGHKFYVVKPNERRTGRPTGVAESGDVKILGVRTLNIQKTNVVEKGVGTLLLEGQYYRAIKKHFGGIKFDVVLYSTPPITFNKVIASLKKRYGAKTYLLLKDIFPQNAVDLGMFSKGSLFYRFFRAKEKRLYALSDVIGCMSLANVEYVLAHNPEVGRERVEVCPNSVEPVTDGKPVDREAVLGRLGIPSDKTVFIYAGLRDMEYLDRQKYKVFLRFTDELAGIDTEKYKLEVWSDGTDDDPTTEEVDEGSHFQTLSTCYYETSEEYDVTRPYLKHEYITVYLNYSFEDYSTSPGQRLKYTVDGNMLLQRDLNTLIPDEDQQIQW